MNGLLTKMIVKDKYIPVSDLVFLRDLLLYDFITLNSCEITTQNPKKLEWNGKLYEYFHFFCEVLGIQIEKLSDKPVLTMKLLTLVEGVYQYIDSHYELKEISGTVPYKTTLIIL